jgi:hypothetical protein
LELGEAIFSALASLVHFKEITSQNQSRVTSLKKTVFDRAPLILSKNQELRVVPKCPLVHSR